ncbi:hypothetical protein BHE74_00035917, partial [Ensete ventricosum]
VKKYSDWVVDGEYDWPPTCCLCHAALEAGSDQTTRLGCLRMLTFHFTSILVFLKGPSCLFHNMFIAVFSDFRSHAHTLLGLTYQKLPTSNCPCRICLSCMFFPCNSSIMFIVSDFSVLCFIQPGAATRKPTYHGRQNSETSYYADDEDGTSKKYTRRGKIIQQTVLFHLIVRTVFMSRACMATMGILYYRLAQRSLSVSITEDEPQ